MSDMEEASALIALIYDSVLTPELRLTALQGVSRFLSVKDMGFGAYDFDSQQTEDMGHLLTDPDYFRSYVDYWAPRNFLWKATSPLPVGQVFSYDAAMPLHDFYRTDLYNEWFHPQKMDKSLGANTLAEGTLSGVVTVYRPSSDPDFSSQDVARFRALLPHFQRAMQMQKRLQVVPHGTENIYAMLAAIGKPTLLADRNARLLCANPAGEALLRDRSLILVEGGQLAARNRDETNRLRKLIHSAAKRNLDGSGGKMIVSREGRASLVLLVSPLPGARLGMTDQLAILFATDPERQSTNPPDLELLRAQYQLTQAEAGLAVSLLSSPNLRCAASRQNIAFSTARTHLAHIFQKTGAHSQLELIRMLRKAGHDN